MHIETADKNGYRIIRVLEDITVVTDLHEVRELIDTCIGEGVSKVALCFTERSRFYTMHISVLVHCLNALRPVRGQLALINPNESIVEALTSIGLTGLTIMYTSEDELGE